VDVHHVRAPCGGGGIEAGEEIDGNRVVVSLCQNV
jgi:phosphatidylserine decarboxylase